MLTYSTFKRSGLVPLIGNIFPIMQIFQEVILERTAYRRQTLFSILSIAPYIHSQYIRLQINIIFQ